MWPGEHAMCPMLLKSLYFYMAFVTLGHADFLAVDKEDPLSCWALYRPLFTSCLPLAHPMCLQLNEHGVDLDTCWGIKRMSLSFPARAATGQIMTSEVWGKPSLCLDAAYPLSNMQRKSSLQMQLYEVGELLLENQPCNGTSSQQWFRDDQNKIRLANYPHLCLGSEPLSYTARITRAAASLVDCELSGLVFQDGYQDVAPWHRPGVVRYMAWTAFALCLLFSSYLCCVLLHWACSRRPGETGSTFNIASRRVIKSSLSRLLQSCTMHPVMHKLWKDDRVRRAEQLFLLYLICIPFLIWTEIIDWLRVSQVGEFLAGGFERLPNYEHYYKITEYLFNRNLLPNLVAGWACAWGWKFVQRRPQGLLVVQACLAGRFIAVAYLRTCLDEFYSKSLEQVPLRLLESVALGDVTTALCLQTCISLAEALMGAMMVNPRGVNLHNFVMSQLFYGAGIILITAICDYARLAYLELHAKSLRSEAAVSRLLDHNSDGYCKVALDGAVISASPQMKATLRHELSGAQLADFLRQEDIAAFSKLLQTSWDDSSDKAVCLVTFQVPASVEKQVFELFDARLVLFAAEEHLGLCVNVLGERRFVNSMELSAEVVAPMDIGLPSAERASNPFPVPSVPEQTPILMSERPPLFPIDEKVESVGHASWKSMPVISGRGRPLLGPKLCAGGDCLPETAEVQVLRPDGQPVQRCVSDLQEGDYVHCFDHLQQGPRYAKIVSVGVTAGACEWTKLVFSDDTMLELTSNHPVRTSGPTKTLKAARELSAMTDHMWVTKTERTVVKDVITSVEDKSRVSVNFAQPARFSMFVSSRGSQLSAVAVESANFEEPTHWYCRNSFMEVADSSVAGSSEKAASAPPILCNACAVADNGTSDTLSHTSGTHVSEFEGAIDVHLKGGDDPSSVSMRDVMMTLRSNILSIGSWEHPTGFCHPCRFQFRHHQDPENNPPCKNGKLCGLCHEVHSAEYYLSSKNHSRYCRKKKQKTHAAITL
eukprot:TRINITY_DN12987_c0_g1_i6.p1 TRINITY_DN12987_c0_g1~~TRINITY_DN12987_c0_g1_i6.p1  ORF type:complete len:993 (+),score=111.45 TRINITY_DN12987_c0_g1_i6:149-3127(+)